MAADGVLVIDKPPGPTSHDVVDRIRVVFGQRKVGHAGTLDPAASGVLVLLLGQATRLSQAFLGADKAYRATIRLGVETTTQDATGEVVRTEPVTAGPAEVAAALQRFQGEIEQIPPMYSAKHVGGKRLHELARRGIEVERPPVKVRIDAVDLVRLDLPDLVVEVRCSSGTYLRTLAHDLGRALACGGHLAALRRTAVGPFRIEDAVALDAAEKDPAAAHRRVLPLGAAASIAARLAERSRERA